MTFPINPALTTYAGNDGLSGTYVPELWSGKMLEKFYMSTVFGEIANTDYEGEIKAHGDTVNIRTTPDISIRDYKVGLDLQYDRPRSDNVTLLIDKGKYFAFSVNDVERKQADIGYVEKWSMDAAQQMKITIDNGVLNDIDADADSDNYGTTAGAESGSIDLGTTGTAGENAIGLTKANIIDKIIECGLVLDEQNVPESERWMVLPSWACARIKMSELKDASVTGGESTIPNGRIGKIDRFTIYSTNNIDAATETSTSCWSALFGHKSALTFATQLIENEKIKNPSDFGDLIRGLQVYGYEVLHGESLGVLYCKAA
jgi:hypothetical protein